MTSGEKYRNKASELLAQANTAKHESTRSKFKNLAIAFMRLAEHADRDQGSTVEFDIPPDLRSIAKT
jgi:hypothetical protein